MKAGDSTPSAIVRFIIHISLASRHSLVKKKSYHTAVIAAVRGGQFVSFKVYMLMKPSPHKFHFASALSRYLNGRSGIVGEVIEQVRRTAGLTSA